MKNLRYFLKMITLIFLLLIIFIGEINAQLYTKHTKFLRVIYYDKQHSYVVPHLMRCFENSLQFHRNLFNYTPTEEVLVLLEDFDDYGYAGATSIPFNYIRLGIEPYKYVFETSPTNERFNWVMSHELTHIVASDKAADSDKFFRSLFFGKVSPTAEHPISMYYSYLTSPRKYSPRWYHEGIAVFMETWMSGGIGRVMGGYDEMVFRSMVRDSSYIYDVVGLESEGTTIDFQVGVNSYLYGTRFVSYLANKFGPEKVLKWFDRTNDSKAFFASQFQNVYGVSLDEEWSSWIDWENGWQKANLDSIRKYPTTHFRQISQRALGSVSHSYYDSTTSKIYTAIRYPGQLAHIAAIDINNGTIEKICNIPTPALYYVSALAFDDSTGKLFFTTNNSSSWRHINYVDIKTGESKRILENARIGDLAINPSDKSLWGVQHHNGIAVLVRIPPPYDDWFKAISLDYGRDLFDIDISPDGLYIIGSLIEIDGSQKLIMMNIEKLLNGDSSYDVLIEFENNTSPENFVFSNNGKYLFGSSYYSGVSNIFRYGIEKKELNAITNCETGFFRPVPISNDSLVVFSYTGDGFVPVIIANEVCEDVSAIKYLGQEIVENFPIVKTWTLGSPLQVNIDSVTTFSGEYHGLQNIKLSSAYPTIEGFKDYAAFGVRLNFFDPLQIDAIDLNASYSPDNNLPENQKIHLALNYGHWPWKFSTTYNRADFYDLFGPTKTSRKGYSVAIQYNNYLIYDRPKTLEYTLSISGYGGLERLPDYQNIRASFDKFLTVKAQLYYKYLRKSLGAVEYEQGITWKFSTYNNYVNAKNFPRIYTNLGYGFLLPLNHSSIWLRSSAGYSYGDRNEPFANFYFGGFGNNWVDYQEEKRYREYYSFPGTKLNAVGGTNFSKMLLEWTLPPLRFRRFGIPNLYCTWSRAVFFTSGIITNLDSEKQKRSLFNGGVQIDFRLIIFSRLESTLSFGYAVAFEKDKRLSKEFMISLKIL